MCHIPNSKGMSINIHIFSLQRVKTKFLVLVCIISGLKNETNLERERICSEEFRYFTFHPQAWFH